MSNFVEWVGVVLSSSAASSGLIVYFGKTWIVTRLQEGIKAEYAERLEELRADLKLKADERVAELQATLAVVSSSKTVAFTNVFERRVKAIAEIHAALLNLNARLTAYIDGLTSDDELDERHSAVVDAFNNFEPTYREHLIFLPKPLADDLAKLKQEHVSITNVFRLMVHKKNTAVAAQQHVGLLERLNQDLPKSMAASEAAMRLILDGDGMTITRISVAESKHQ